jgi:hypothetical protein
MSPRERLTVSRFSGHVQAERVMPSEAPRFKPFRHLSYISDAARALRVSVIPGQRMNS